MREPTLSPSGNPRALSPSSLSTRPCLFSLVYPLYLSIGSWVLLLNSPRCSKNVSSQSSERLALQFLCFGGFPARLHSEKADPMSGDITNLMGCILTNQLSFQVTMPS